MSKYFPHTIQRITDTRLRHLIAIKIDNIIHIIYYTALYVYYRHNIRYLLFFLFLNCTTRMTYYVYNIMFIMKINCLLE